MNNRQKLAVLTGLVLVGCDSPGAAPVAEPTLTAAHLPTGLECRLVEGRGIGPGPTHLLQVPGSPEQYSVSWVRAEDGLLELARVEHSGGGKYRKITLREADAWLEDAALVGFPDHEVVSERGHEAMRSEAAALVRALVRRVERGCSHTGG